MKHSTQFLFRLFGCRKNGDHPNSLLLKSRLSRLKNPLLCTALPAFNFEEYNRFQKPQHNKAINPMFLEWFIGFAEGDGSFYIKTESYGPRVMFEISQKDPQHLYRIKKVLGFGRVRETKTPTGEPFWKYVIDSKDNIPRIASIFNGHLILPKKIIQFDKWLQAAITTGCLPADYINKQADAVKTINLKDEQGIKALYCGESQLLALNNGWLAGFFDADGGFSATYRKADPKNYQSARITTRIYITQRDDSGDKVVLQMIGKLLKSKANVSPITNSYYPRRETTPYFRIDMQSQESQLLFQEYLRQYPLYTSKVIACRRWERILAANQRFIEPEQLPRLERLAIALNACSGKIDHKKNFEPENKVL